MAFHHGPQVLKLLCLALLSGLVAVLPLFYLLEQVLVLLLLRLVLLLEGEVDVVELILKTLVLVVESLANLVELFVLLSGWGQSYL